ncbi:MAG: translation initiation factor IF-2, partial [Mucilaginibacter polytrichastri]|nr:translation initiation factor IF-2 [Mucilaginibacter polytrichastri]
MSEEKVRNLLKVAKEFNVGLNTISDFLGKKGYAVESKPMSKITQDMYDSLLKEYQGDKVMREEANKINIGKVRMNEPQVIETHHEPVAAPATRVHEPDQDEILIKNINTTFTPPAPAPAPEPKPAPAPEEKETPAAPAAATPQREESALPGPKIVGKIDLNNLSGKKAEQKEQAQPKAETPAAPVEAKQEPVVSKPAEPVKEETPAAKPAEEKPAVAEQPAPAQNTPAKEDQPQPAEVIRAKAQRLTGPNVIGKINLPVDSGRRGNSPVASSSGAADQKRKRKRKENTGGPQQGGNNQQQGGRPDFRGGNRPGGGPGGRP